MGCGPSTPAAAARGAVTSPGPLPTAAAVAPAPAAANLPISPAGIAAAPPPAAEAPLPAATPLVARAVSHRLSVDPSKAADAASSAMSGAGGGNDALLSPSLAGKVTEVGHLMLSGAFDNMMVRDGDRLRGLRIRPEKASRRGSKRDVSRSKRISDGGMEAAAAAAGGSGSARGADGRIASKSRDRAGRRRSTERDGGPGGRPPPPAIFALVEGDGEAATAAAAEVDVPLSSSRSAGSAASSASGVRPRPKQASSGAIVRGRVSTDSSSSHAEAPSSVALGNGVKRGRISSDEDSDDEPGPAKRHPLTPDLTAPAGGAAAPSGTADMAGDSKAAAAAAPELPPQRVAVDRFGRRPHRRIATSSSSDSADFELTGKPKPAAAPAPAPTIAAAASGAATVARGKVARADTTSDSDAHGSDSDADEDDDDDHSDADDDGEDTEGEDWLAPTEDNRAARAEFGDAKVLQQGVDAEFQRADAIHGLRLRDMGPAGKRANKHKNRRRSVGAVPGGGEKAVRKLMKGNSAADSSGSGASSDELDEDDGDDGEGVADYLAETSRRASPERAASPASGEDSGDDGRDGKTLRTGGTKRSTSSDVAGSPQRRAQLVQTNRSMASMASGSGVEGAAGLAGSSEGTVSIASRVMSTGESSSRGGTARAAGVLATSGTVGDSDAGSEAPRLTVTTAELFERENFQHFDKEWESLQTLKLVFSRAGLDDEQQALFVRALQEKSYRDPEYIVHQGGDASDGFYIITEGEVAVTRIITPEEDVKKDAAVTVIASPSGERERVITHLYVGHFFGETALVRDEPRNANVRVLKGVVRCMVMSRETFKPFLERDPKFRKMIGELVLKKEETTRKREEMLKAHGGAIVAPSAQRNEVKVSKLVNKSRTREGALVINGYVLRHKLGQGSYGKVYMAQSLVDNQKYAVKIVDRSLLRKKRIGNAKSTDDDMLREVAVMKRLHHPNIVGLVEVIDDPKGKYFYMVQEFMELGPIMTETEYNHPLDPDLARSYFRDMLCGVEYLHFQGVCHRDIKPSNILVCPGETQPVIAKIADFGTAAVTADGRGHVTDVKGTPAFQPPEIFLLEKGQMYNGFTQDIWALGATLHCMVVGVPPFMADNEVELVEKLRTEEFRLATTVQLDPHLRNLLVRCLTKDPAARISLKDIMTHEWVTEEGTKPLLTQLYVQLHLAETSVATETSPTVAAAPGGRRSRIGGASAAAAGAGDAAAAAATGLMPTPIAPPSRRLAPGSVSEAGTATSPQGPSSPDPRGGRGLTATSTQPSKVISAVLNAPPHGVVESSSDEEGSSEGGDRLGRASRGRDRASSTGRSSGVGNVVPSINASAAGRGDDVGHSASRRGSPFATSRRLGAPAITRTISAGTPPMSERRTLHSGAGSSPALKSPAARDRSPAGAQRKLEGQGAGAGFFGEAGEKDVTGSNARTDGTTSAGGSHLDAKHVDSDSESDGDSSDDEHRRVRTSGSGRFSTHASTGDMRPGLRAMPSVAARNFRLLREGSVAGGGGAGSSISPESAAASPASMRSPYGSMMVMGGAAVAGAGGGAPSARSGMLSGRSFVGGSPMMPNRSPHLAHATLSSSTVSSAVTGSTGEATPSSAASSGVFPRPRFGVGGGPLPGVGAGTAAAAAGAGAGALRSPASMLRMPAPARVRTDITSAAMAHRQALERRQLALLAGHRNIRGKDFDALVDQKRMLLHADRAVARVEEFIQDETGTYVDEAAAAASMITSPSGTAERRRSPKTGSSGILSPSSASGTAFPFARPTSRASTDTSGIGGSASSTALGGIPPTARTGRSVSSRHIGGGGSTGDGTITSPTAAAGAGGGRPRRRSVDSADVEGGATSSGMSLSGGSSHGAHASGTTLQTTSYTSMAAGGPPARKSLTLITSGAAGHAGTSPGLTPGVTPGEANPMPLLISPAVQRIRRMSGQSGAGLAAPVHTSSSTGSSVQLTPGHGVGSTADLHQPGTFFDGATARGGLSSSPSATDLPPRHHRRRSSATSQHSTAAAAAGGGVGGVASPVSSGYDTSTSGHSHARPPALSAGATGSISGDPSSSPVAADGIAATGRSRAAGLGTMFPLEQPHPVGHAHLPPHTHHGHLHGHAASVPIDTTMLSPNLRGDARTIGHHASAEAAIPSADLGPHHNSIATVGTVRHGSAATAAGRSPVAAPGVTTARTAMFAGVADSAMPPASVPPHAPEPGAASGSGSDLRASTTTSSSAAGGALSGGSVAAEEVVESGESDEETHARDAREQKRRREAHHTALSRAHHEAGETPHEPAGDTAPSARHEGGDSDGKPMLQRGRNFVMVPAGVSKTAAGVVKRRLVMEATDVDGLSLFGGKVRAHADGTSALSRMKKQHYGAAAAAAGAEKGGAAAAAAKDGAEGATPGASPQLPGQRGLTRIADDRRKALGMRPTKASGPTPPEPKRGLTGGKASRAGKGAGSDSDEDGDGSDSDSSMGLSPAKGGKPRPADKVNAAGDSSDDDGEAGDDSDDDSDSDSSYEGVMTVDDMEGTGVNKTLLEALEPIEEAAGDAPRDDPDMQLLSTAESAELAARWSSGLLRYSYARAPYTPQRVANIMVRVLDNGDPVQVLDEPEGNGAPSACSSESDEDSDSESDVEQVKSGRKAGAAGCGGGANEEDSDDDLGLGKKAPPSRARGGPATTMPSPRKAGGKVATTFSTPNLLALRPGDRVPPLPPTFHSRFFASYYVYCPLGYNARLNIMYGAAERRGTRAAMEDRTMCIPDLNLSIDLIKAINTHRVDDPLLALDADGKAPSDDVVFRRCHELEAEVARAVDRHRAQYAYFAVFDGHAGMGTSSELAQALHLYLAMYLALLPPDGIIATSPSKEGLAPVVEESAVHAEGGAAMTARHIGEEDDMVRAMVAQAEASIDGGGGSLAASGGGRQPAVPVPVSATALPIVRESRSEGTVSLPSSTPPDSTRRLDGSGVRTPADSSQLLLPGQIDDGIVSLDSARDSESTAGGSRPRTHPNSVSSSSSTGAGAAAGAPVPAATVPLRGPLLSLSYSDGSLSSAAPAPFTSLTSAASNPGGAPGPLTADVTAAATAMARLPVPTPSPLPSPTSSLSSSRTTSTASTAGAGAGVSAGAESGSGAGAMPGSVALGPGASTGALSADAEPLEAPLCTYDEFDAAALAEACLHMDDDVLAAITPVLDEDGEVLEERVMSGATGIVLLVKMVPSPTGALTAPVIFCANIGDCRAVMSRGGRALNLSNDHKVTRPDELERIVAAGGKVTKGRLHGVLAVSRAFGDPEHKIGYGSSCWGTEFTSNPLLAEPEVSSIPVQPEDEFVVMACDGVWDVMTSQQVINYVRRQLAKHGDAGQAARDLLRKALDLYSVDNVTAVVVLLNAGTSLRAAGAT